jgi:glycosyltransferase involved in cell wall biosynthesis
MSESGGRGSRILYITYDGLTDPLGRSQVLPYLVGLSALGHRISILSCEKPQRLAREQARIREICAAAGIAWHPRPYHKRPPVLSGAWDAWMLTRAAARLHRRAPFDIVHCRSYIPAMAGLSLKRRFGVRFLFDMRGLWPDERVEGGSWPQSSPVYRAVYAYFKRVEARLLQQADHIISLTSAGDRQLRAMPALAGRSPAVTVVPCCADFDHFRLVGADDRARSRAALGIDPAAKVLAYLGSIGSWYMLDEMLDLFRLYAARFPSAVLLFVTHEPEARLRSAAAARGVDPARILVRAASREQVPELVAAADAGLFFIKPVPSKTASSPTKMAEIMALGLPILTNGGVGDVAEIVADTSCGAVVERFDRAGYEAAIDDLEAVAASPEEIRSAGLRWFDVAEGIRRYDRVYRTLARADG